MQEKKPTAASAATTAAFAIGDKVVAFAGFDQEWHNASIVSTAPATTGTGDDELSYYVHYENFDKRLDEWVSMEQIQCMKNGVEDDRCVTPVAARIAQSPSGTTTHTTHLKDTGNGDSSHKD